jgi:3-methyladenine DNA glycosylase AlkC
MAEPFKNLIGRAEVAWLATELRAVWPRFPAKDFEQRAGEGLQALELKARARHIADALEHSLPADEAFAVLTSMLKTQSGTGGFGYLPISEYLERHGPRDVKAALTANYELTQRFTSEFSIRSLILEAWGPTSKALSKWVCDDSEHVRRLVSEGTRPRLPWGRQLPPFIEDPSPVLPLLEQLKDDPSEYVRRSVANNLNDIAKDHPEVVRATAKRWLVGASKERRRLVEHSLRTLLKRGDAAALALIGAGDAKAVKAKGIVTPKRVKLGERVTFAATLTNTSRKKTHAVVEARVHFVKVRGTSPKPFRLARVDLEPGQTVELSKSMELQHRSIRRLFAGRHEVELQVNGARSSMGAFELSL